MIEGIRWRILEIKEEIRQEANFVSVYGVTESLVSGPDSWMTQICMKLRIERFKLLSFAWHPLLTISWPDSYSVRHTAHYLRLKIPPGPRLSQEIRHQRNNLPNPDPTSSICFSSIEASLSKKEPRMTTQYVPAISRLLVHGSYTHVYVSNIQFSETLRG